MPKPQDDPNKDLFGGTLGTSAAISDLERCTSGEIPPQETFEELQAERFGKFRKLWAMGKKGFKAKLDWEASSKHW